MTRLVKGESFQLKSAGCVSTGSAPSSLWAAENYTDGNGNSDQSTFSREYPYAVPLRTLIPVDNNHPYNGVRARA